MDDFDNELEHPKKRRRRMEPKKPLSARLIFDDNLRGDTAALSLDLWGEFFATQEASRDAESRSEGQPVYVALSPSSPFYTGLDEIAWAITPASKHAPSPGSDSVPRATVLLNPSAPACQSFLKLFETIDQSRHGHHVPKQIDVRITEVEPISLETVYVTVEKGLLQKVDEIQSRFGGGFHFKKATKLDKTPQPAYAKPGTSNVDEKDRLSGLVREGLSQLMILHSGDVFQLPLPAHPITHVRPRPAIAIHCEPVLQGRVSSSTKIVLVQAGSSQEKALKQLQAPQPIIEESIEDTAEDTTNDQFYSAAEERQNGTSSEVDGLSSEDQSESEASADHSDDDSDDSMDDMISLSAPGLPPQPSGTLSAMTAATPRPGDRRGTGMHTPGSVYSSFTAATARTDARPGKVFRTESLLKIVPREALHPRPSAEDDEEAFVFVDTSTLAKIGCFSGDWVRIEVAKNMSSHGFPSLGFGNMDNHSDEDNDWRAVRIFGLSGLPSQRPRYAVDKSGQRRSSFSQGQPFSLTPTIYMPPMLVANLRRAQFVKVGVLPKPTSIENPRTMSSQARPAILKSPPLATEVLLEKVSTPTITERDLDLILFSGLKRYFEARKRILKRGDMIAILVDEDLGRATFSSGSTSESPGFDNELASRLEATASHTSRKSSLAWFRVKYISTEQIQDLDDIAKRDVWGGTTTTDPSNAKMTQAGNTLQPIAESTIEHTEYWLESKRLPKQWRISKSPIHAASDLPARDYLPLESRIRDLVAAATSPRAISLGMPPLVILLHSNQRLIGKSHTAIAACTAAGVNTFTISAHDLLSENAATTGGGDYKTETLLKTRAERAMSCGPQFTSLLIQHIELLTADRMAPTLQEIISSVRVLIATTTELEKVPPGIRSLFTHELEVGAPNETDRELILRRACLSLSSPISSNVSTKSVALQTAALVAGDLVDVVNRAALARSRRLLDLAHSRDVTLSDLAIAGGMAVSHIMPSDFNAAIFAARATFSDAIGAPKIPTVTWADVGGLAAQKDAIMETISLPLTRPELFANGIRKRSGILFYGPPGTGKTLLAKAIATEFSLNFFSVKGPELLNMYIGESEANVRRVFQRARDARPCVVFFDELDSVAPKRGNQGDSGGVMDRIVSQLLAELDGMSSGGSSGDDGQDSSGGGGGVFVIGATNRPDLLDPALLRPGRFDKMLYLGVASDHEQQATILQALTRKFKLERDVDLKRVASRLPLTYTGADLYALCSDAMLKAITRKTKMVDRKVAEISMTRNETISTGYFFDHLAGPEDVEVVVGDADFMAAQAELAGSVSAKELEHFDRIRRVFEEQDVGSGSGRAKGKGKEREQATRLPTRPSTAAIRPGSKEKTSGESTHTTTSIGSGKGRGKGKQRADHHKGIGIANPDSGAESDGDDDRIDGYGVFAGHMNGSVHNDKGKGKGKERVSSNGNGNGFQDDAEGDDEGLYS